MKNEFKPLTKEERVEVYGGFAWMAAIPLVISAVQTAVSCGVAIYQAVHQKTGSVSFGGSRTITQKYQASTNNSSQQKTKLHKVNATTFTAY
ncbi:hypothetical protein [Mycoplasma todarodis]|uniref:Uncharacterized protein n=1 Tax=Mycoplasma todarodis TaxID=1937191 RepID=A0A4R0XNA3_9MOLU|nr:hypothetical protein [Mycoplasma todarodis]TCG10425.1 hypothetical protein C4B25_04210 [Mycoplasma todarodis]